MPADTPLAYSRTCARIPLTATDGFAPVRLR
jgi:hypothetical protein